MPGLCCNLMNACVKAGNANGPCKHKTQTCLTSTGLKKKNPSTSKLACYHMPTPLLDLTNLYLKSRSLLILCVKSLFTACMPLSFALLFRDAVPKHISL